MDSAKKKRNITQNNIYINIDKKKIWSKMCNEIKCAIQYTVDLINNNINRDVQEECKQVVAGIYTRNMDDENSECFTVY